MDRALSLGHIYLVVRGCAFMEVIELREAFPFIVVIVCDCFCALRHVFVVRGIVNFLVN